MLHLLNKQLRHKAPPRDATSGLEAEGVLLTEIPSLADMGYPEQSTRSLFPGGETEGLRRLAAQVISRPQWVNAFEKPATTPNSLEPSTTVLGPYLKFGCVSVRKVYHELKKIQAGAKGAYTKPPVSLEGQLLWREFFYVHALHTPHFDRMEGNPRFEICFHLTFTRYEQLFI